MRVALRSRVENAPEERAVDDDSARAIEYLRAVCLVRAIIADCCGEVFVI